MDTNTVILVLGLLFFGIMMLVAVILSSKWQKEYGTSKNKKHLEFSKLLMLSMISMWILGGLVGFWVVLLKDYTLLSEVQTYVSYPVTAGIAFYSAKSGAENWKKLSNDKVQEEGQNEV